MICDSNLSTAVQDESGIASRVRCQVVSGNFFTALGVSALHGRVLAPADELPAAGTFPVVLSYAYWQSRFRGDPSIVGRKLYMRGQPFEAPDLGGDVLQAGFGEQQEAVEERGGERQVRPGAHRAGAAL